MQITRAISRAAAATLAAAVLLTPLPTHAHAALVDSDPADGARLTALPATVSVTLNEPVAEPAHLVVTDAGGRVVDASPAEVEGRTVTTVLRGDDAPGGYHLAYRVVSVDGHPVTGTVEFTVAGPAPTRPAPTPAATAAPRSEASDASSWIPVLGGVVALGLAGCAALLLAGRRSARDEDAT